MIDFNYFFFLLFSPLDQFRKLVSPPDHMVVVAARSEIALALSLTLNKSRKKITPAILALNL